MRLLAFSDLHHQRSKAAAIVTESQDADLVIGAGDFCNARRDLPAAMEMLAGLTAQMVAVPGNAESAAELVDASASGTTVLHGTRCQAQGFEIFGLGYAVPETPFGDWSCDLSEEEAAAMLAPCQQADILVVHSPPKGVADTTSRGDSVGSVAIYDAIKRIQPRLALCGHIHDSWGQSGRIGDTKVVNLGPDPVWFDM